MTYAVAMHKDDWKTKIEFVYPDILMQECQEFKDDPNIVECMIHLSKEHPTTGWQLKDKVYGIHWAYIV